MLTMSLTPVNINLSLLEIAKLVSNNFKTDIEINYNFNNTKSNENYLGEPKIYKQLLDEYKINVLVWIIIYLKILNI